jgi:hypothetical protein
MNDHDTDPDPDEDMTPEQAEEAYNALPRSEQLRIEADIQKIFEEWDRMTQDERAAIIARAEIAERERINERRRRLRRARA